MSNEQLTTTFNLIECLINNSSRTLQNCFEQNSEIENLIVSAPQFIHDFLQLCAQNYGYADYRISGYKQSRFKRLSKSLLFPLQQ